MFCTNCGAENKDGAHYCYSCGAPLTAPEGQKAPADAAGAAEAAGKTVKARPDDVKSGSTIAFPPIEDESDKTVKAPVPSQPYDASAYVAGTGLDVGGERSEKRGQDRQRQQAAGSGQSGRGSRGPVIAGVIIAAVAVAAIAWMLVAKPFESGAGDDAAATSQQQEQQQTDTQDSGSSADDDASGDANSTTSDSGNASQSDDSSNQDEAKDDAAQDSDSTSTDSNSSITMDDDGTVHDADRAYTLTLPSGFSASGGSGDEATFANGDINVSLQVTGNGGTSLDEAYTAAKAEQPDAEYTADGKNWYVISYADGGNIYYEETIVESDSMATMMISYPESDKTAGDAVINAVQPTFRHNG